MNQPKEPTHHVPLSISMLISEWVYKLVVLIERTIRWIARYIFRPCLLQVRCLLWF